MPDQLYYNLAPTSLGGTGPYGTYYHILLTGDWVISVPDVCAMSEMLARRYFWRFFMICSKVS